MAKIHCSLSYHKLPFDKVEPFAEGVKTGFYTHNPPFTVLPLTESAYEALITEYSNKRNDYVNGGAAQKGPFLIAKTALMDGTDLLAEEVDKKANGDAEIIILAGFEPTKAPGETTKPGQCVVTIKRGIAGELIATCEPIAGVTNYGCIMVEGGALPAWFTINSDGRIIVDQSSWEPPTSVAEEPGKVKSIQFDLTNQREKHFAGLTHDAVYYFYYYAVNAKGVGPISEVVSMVCW
jgi:hypothetical protein